MSQIPSQSKSVQNMISECCDSIPSYIVTEMQNLAEQVDAQSAALSQLRSRLDEVEKERLPHMCRADHVEIRHGDSTSELCPLCRANNTINQLRLSNERMERALKGVVLAIKDHDSSLIHPKYRAGYNRDYATEITITIGQLQDAFDALQPPPESGSEVRG